MTRRGGPERWDRGDLSAGHTPPPADSDGPGALLHAGAPGPSTNGPRRGPSEGSGPTSDAEADPLGWDLFEDADEEDRPRQGRRGRLLLVAAIVPWLLVGAVLVRTPAGPTPTDPTAGHDGTAHGEHAPGVPEANDDDIRTYEDGDAGDPWADPPVASQDAWAETPVLTEPDALVFGGRVSAGAGEAAAVGLLVAREWLGDVGVPLEADLATGASGSYVEHLTIEDVDLPAPDAAVVTVVAVVLAVEEDVYGSAEVVRLAVPVRLAREGARPAGEPWRLPPPDLRMTELTATAVDEPRIATEAGAALSEAGYEVTEIVSVGVTDGWPLVVTAEAVAPGERTSRRHRVWVRRHLDRLVVAGWLPEVRTDADGRPVDGRSGPDQYDGAPSPATAEDD